MLRRKKLFCRLTYCKQQTYLRKDFSSLLSLPGAYATWQSELLFWKRIPTAAVHPRKVKRFSQKADLSF